MIPSFFGSIVNPITPFNPSNFKESVQNLTITSIGSPILSTAQKKFGTSSLYLNNYNVDALSVVNNSAWNIATNNGGFDFWLNISSGYPQGFVSQGNWFTYGNGAYALQSSIELYGGIFTSGTWRHLEFNQTGGITRFFLDGILAASSPSIGYFTSNSNPLLIGETSVYRGFQGYMDELRFFDSAHAHTNNFTPPTTPYVNADALALFHFDG